MPPGDQLDYYAGHGLITDPHECAALLDGLPARLDDLVDVIRGVLIGVHWVGAYGLDLPARRREETRLRSVRRMLHRLHELDHRPLTTDRPPGRRLVATGRDHAVLLCAVLRHRGVPARARCGLAAYLRSEHRADHWVCEYYDDVEQRWLLVDAQLDRPQRRELRIGFDPLDVPRDRFVTAGVVWRRRSGLGDPDADLAGDLVRDLLALNKIEVLPWDRCGLVPEPDRPVPHDDLAVLGRIAELTGADDRWPAARVLFAEQPRLHTDPGWLRP